jgi:hypothetical protein
MSQRDRLFEPKVGISRAVRSGKIIAVTGTAPLGPDGKTVAIGVCTREAMKLSRRNVKASE